MAEKTEISFLSSDGRTTVYATLWKPEGEPLGVIQICHGMAEHIGRYEWLAGQLCERGYAVCGDDHLGHGRTALSEEDLGYFGENGGWDHLIEDEHGMRRELEKRFPDRPLYLLGHSMGSFITRGYVARHGNGLAGYICWGTSGPVPGMGFGLLLTNLLCVFGQGEKRGRFIDKIAHKGYLDQVTEEKTGLGLEWLSRDPSVYQLFDDDPKGNFIFTNAGFRDLFRLLKNVKGPRWSDRVPKDLPILIMSGDKDPVGQFGKGPRLVAGWLRDSGVRDVTLKLYEGARHELHNEINRDEVVADLTSWLKDHGNKEDTANGSDS